MERNVEVSNSKGHANSSKILDLANEKNRDKKIREENGVDIGKEK